MRREHVHKICANQRITPTMTIKEESPKQFSWSAIDFSDNEPKTEMLLARFKLVEEATSFKNEFLKVNIMRALNDNVFISTNVRV